jgi:hypothetical protein
VTKVDFLGFIIEAGKILMDPAKLKGILEWPAPMTVMQLRSFIGFLQLLPPIYQSLFGQMRAPQ